MSKALNMKFFSLALVFFASISFATANTSSDSSDGEKDLKTEINEYIQHHLQDSYDFSLYSYTNSEHEHVYIGFPLPVILWDNGLQVFSSSKLHHGDAIAEVNGNYYALIHGKIYKGDAGVSIDQMKEALEHDHHAYHKIMNDFSITKSVVMMLLTGLLMFWLFSSLAKSYAKNKGIPTGFARIFEPIVLYIRDDIAEPNIGPNYKKYMSYLLTIFFFVWFLNLFGLTPLGVNVTGNIAVTFGLALLTFLITNLTGNKNYWGHIFWMPGVPVPMKILLAPIELLGVIIKPFALMIRLWANMSAGHIVLMSIIGLMFIFHSWLGSSLSFLLSFVLAILELLVAALQAYIFTMLSALYFGFANEEAHH